MLRTLTDATAASHAADLHLVVAGGLPPETAYALPELRRCFAQGTRHGIAAEHGGVLLALAGFGADAPRAAFARLGAGLDARGCWSELELVHLAPTLDSMRFMRLLGAALHDAERDALLEALAPRLAGSGARLDLARRQLLWSTPLATLDAHPAMLDGRDARDAFDAQRAAPDYQRLLLDLQMLLHAHPVNAARATRGAPPANALWCHGSGALPPTRDARFAAASGEDPLLAGLAQWMGCAYAVEPRTTAPGVTVVHAEDVGESVAEALDALAAGAFAALWLHLAPHGTWRVGRGARWRFWRRAPSFDEVFGA